MEYAYQKACWLLPSKREIGQALYTSTIVLKMLLLSSLWSVSERMVETLANDGFSIGLLLGLGADENAPERSTSTLFKAWLVEKRA